MSTGVDRLVQRLGALELIHTADVRNISCLESRGGELASALARANMAIHRCIPEVTELVRTDTHSPENNRHAQAAQIWQARHALADARQQVELAHRLVEEARVARQRAIEMREDDKRRRERMHERADRHHKT
jgi:hypothetical protein